MADSNDDRTNSSGKADAGNTGDPQVQEALRREADQKKGLIGNTDENRNLTGSTTYETLPDQGQDSQDAGGNR